MANLYKSRKKSDQKSVLGGYKHKIWFAPVNTFTSIKTPIAVPLALGDKRKIITAHTFGAPDGFIPWETKKHAVTSSAETTGDDGVKSFQWKFEFILLGDDASTQEQIEDMLNDDHIVLLKDQDCLNTSGFVQFGDECLQPTYSVTFTGNTTNEGNKEYKVEGTIRDKKFFYTATVTEKPE